MLNANGVAVMIVMAARLSSSKRPRSTPGNSALAAVVTLKAVASMPITGAMLVAQLSLAVQAPLAATMYCQYLPSGHRGENPRPSDRWAPGIGLLSQS